MQDLLFLAVTSTPAPTAPPAAGGFDPIGFILWPLKWLVELILVAFHWVFTTLGMDTTSGLTWVFSIIGLVIVVRAALVPLFVKQIKSQRKMMEIAPELKKIQEKYKGKRDQLSREAMSRETMGLYKKNGTSPGIRRTPSSRGISASVAETSASSCGSAAPGVAIPRSAGRLARATGPSRWM